MATTLMSAEAERFRHGMRVLLDEHDGRENAAEVERVAAGFVALGQVPGAGPELASAAVESLEAAGDTRAAGVLAATALLARPPLASEAEAALDRLHEQGVRSPVEESVGTLAVEEAWRLDFGEGEALAVVLARPGERQVQGAVVIIEREATGGAAVDAKFSPPGPRRTMDRFLRDTRRTLGSDCRSLIPEELAVALGEALARSAEISVGMPFELAAAAPILARALTGDPAAFAPVAVEGSHELAVDPEDDEEFEAASQELAEHLVEVCDGDPVVERSGGFVATTMLDYKWRYGDCRLGSWTPDDIDEYLLDYFPRKVSADRELVRDTPACVAAFLTMLAHHGALEGASLESLCAHVEATSAEFRRAARDQTRWGPAKSAMTAMLDAGVAPDDPEAVAAWIDVVNGDRFVPEPGGFRRSGRRGSNADRAKQRKAARAARRRNRR